MTWILPHVILLTEVSLIIFAIAHMLRQRRSPQSTVAWLLVIVMLPYVGVLAYLLLGGRKLKRDIKKKAAIRFDSSGNLPTDSAASITRLLRSYEISAPRASNRMALCRDGAEGYQLLTEMIERATKSIDFATFIFAQDELGEDIINRLIRRAREGVAVRLLIDGLGSLKTSHRFFTPLIQAGGQFSYFKPVIHFPFRGLTNLRNHRKIAITDAHCVFAGGMNITRNDLYRESFPGAWQDLSFIVSGSVAIDYLKIFHADWEFATGLKIENEIDKESHSADHDHIYSNLVSSRMDKTAIVQVVPSGPDVPEDPLHDAILCAIHTAQERIWVVTPYFIPDDSLQQALTIACRRGIDVRLLVPAKSNHSLSDFASASLLRQLEWAGASVLRFQPGMMHAKMMIFDSDLAMVGSANLDMRSLFLNYEVMNFVYSAPEIREMEAWFVALSAHAPAGMPSAGPWQEFFESGVRILTPLL